MRMGLNVFNAMLSGRDFMAGDAVTALDFAVFPFLKYRGDTPDEDGRGSPLSTAILASPPAAGPRGGRHSDPRRMDRPHRRDAPRLTCGSRSSPTPTCRAARGGCPTAGRADARRRPDPARRRLQRGVGARADLRSSAGWSLSTGTSTQPSCAASCRSPRRSTSRERRSRLIHDAGPPKGRLARMRPGSPTPTRSSSATPTCRCTTSKTASRSSTRAARPSAAAHPVTPWEWRGSPVEEGALELDPARPIDP